MTDRPTWILWIDSAEASHGWDAPRGNAGRAGSLCHALGYIVAEDDESVTIAAVVDPVNGHAPNAVTIHKLAIQDRKDVVWG